ncbi:MAG: hypothetical protein GX079_01795 [Tissierellia bacterium]|nr:hypothetical protein [Tissierellia bacterium]
MTRLDVKTKLETRELKKMLVAMTIFSNRAHLAIMASFSFLAAVINWFLMGFKSIFILFIFAFLYLSLIVFILVRKTLAENRVRGHLDFLDKDQYYSFYYSHFSFKAPNFEEFVDVPYSEIESVSQGLGFIFIRLFKNNLLIIKKSDLEGEGQELMQLLQVKKRTEVVS